MSCLKIFWKTDQVCKFELSFTHLSPAPFAAMCQSSKLHCRAHSGSSGRWMLLDFFCSPLGKGSLSSVANGTVSGSVFFFSWNYTFLWALYGKLLSLLMFKTCLIASPSRNWVQYVIHYLQCVFFFGNDTLQESSNGKGKLMEFIILLSFLSSVPLGRGRLILLLMVRIQKGTSRFFV